MFTGNKGDAFLSFQKAIEFINENCGVSIESDRIESIFNEKNE